MKKQKGCHSIWLWHPNLKIHYNPLRTCSNSAMNANCVSCVMNEICVNCVNNVYSHPSVHSMAVPK